MWRGGSTAASAARALRSRLLLDPIHHPATSLAPIASSRTSSYSTPSTAAANTTVEEAAAAVSVSQHTGSISDSLRHYGKCYWELSKARLRCAIPPAPWICCNVSRNKFRIYKLNNKPSFYVTISEG
jgi:heme o synthase